MRNLIIYLSALAALSPRDSLAFTHGAAQLRDLFAYPKYEVQFLNDLPVSTADAELAASLGIEREEEWLSLRLDLGGRKRLGDGTSVPDDDRLELIPMALTPPGSSQVADYLCLMPSKNSTNGQTAYADVEESAELDPVQSWAALSHLEGKCLYTKQGWFSYSYCHNSHIRQFRQLMPTSGQHPGTYEIEEDSSYDAYTLGRASNPPSRKRLSGQSGEAHSVSVGSSASSRYLVQRWSDGTKCDKTGRPREVEIQIHCSMTSNDAIYWIKEMAICQYVVIIHSPHLCSLPGFKAPQVDVQAAGIRCRQKVPDEDFEKWASGERTKAGQDAEAERPFRLPWAPKERDVQSQAATPAPAPDAAPPSTFSAEHLSAVLRQALEAHQTAHGKDHAEVEDVMVLSLEEDEEGNVVLSSNLEEELRHAVLGDDERDLVLQMVQKLLDGKDNEAEAEEEEEGIPARDEL